MRLWLELIIANIKGLSLKNLFWIAIIISFITAIAYYGTEGYDHSASKPDKFKYHTPRY